MPPDVGPLLGLAGTVQKLDNICTPAGILQKVQEAGQLGWKVISTPVANYNPQSADLLGAIGGLDFPVLAGLIYSFKAGVLYNHGNAGGIRLTVNGPANPTRLNYISRWGTGATSEAVNHGLTAYELPAAASTGAPSGDDLATIEGIIIPSADGTVTFEIAGNTGLPNIAVRTGSYIEWRRLA